MVQLLTIHRKIVRKILSKLFSRNTAINSDSTSLKEKLENSWRIAPLGREKGS